LKTVIEEVVACEISVAGMAAVNLELLTNVVGRELPFQRTTDPAMKPVPWTANVNPAPPGATAAGVNGQLTKGTGFAAPAAGTMIEEERRNRLKVPITFLLIVHLRAKTAV